MSEQDRSLGHMDETELDEHRQRHASMQEAIGEVVAAADGLSITELVARLEAALAARGIGPQPRRWLESVAMEAQHGRIYVEEAHQGTQEVLERIEDGTETP